MPYISALVGVVVWYTAFERALQGPKIKPLFIKWTTIVFLTYAAAALAYLGYSSALDLPINIVLGIAGAVLATGIASALIWLINRVRNKRPQFRTAMLLNAVAELYIAVDLCTREANIRHWTLWHGLTIADGLCLWLLIACSLLLVVHRTTKSHGRHAQQYGART
jgi:uncharacterized membrane protein